MINMDPDPSEKVDASHDDAVKWAEDESSDGDSDLAYLATEAASSLEISLASTAFIHGIDSPSTMKAALAFMYSQQRKGPALSFDGIGIDTAAKRKSVMGIRKHEAYKREFGLTIPVIRAKAQLLKRIGGSGRGSREARIQIPFSALYMGIDVTFFILEEDSSYLLSNGDRIELKISSQGRYLHVGTKRQALTLEKYFFIYRWTSDTIPYALYI